MVKNMKKYMLAKNKKTENHVTQLWELKLIADRFDFWQWAKNRVIAFNFKCQNGKIKL